MTCFIVTFEFLKIKFTGWRLHIKWPDLEIVGQPVSEADRKFLTVQKVLGGSSFLWEFLHKLLKTNDDYYQKIWYDINNTENFLPKTLYNTSFHKLSTKWELFWIDFGLRFTCFAEIIWFITHADRNTFHSFQVWWV